LISPKGADGCVTADANDTHSYKHDRDLDETDYRAAVKTEPGWFGTDEKEQKSNEHTDECDSDAHPG